MRGTSHRMPPLHTQAPFRPAPNAEGDGESSSSNSPARADYEESDFYGGNNDSQSSIGVPTFQDMAVSEEEDACISPIDRLPAEVLINIFSKLPNLRDLLQCMLVSKRWARNSVDLLWHRPACMEWEKHRSICHTLSKPNPYFAYRDFIKRLNLASLSPDISDGSVVALQVCTRIERLTLTNCLQLTDQGIVGLLKDNQHLLALDISGCVEVTEASMKTLARDCKRLQGLNITGCTRINNQSLLEVADSCRSLKRIKLNDCEQLEDATVISFALNCPNILEIDLHQCRQIGDEPVQTLLTNGRSLRELRLAGCDMISDLAFLGLPTGISYEHLRILDLTSCARLTDRAVEKIISVAPKLRNLVFAKCRSLTDIAVAAISKLGKNLHYLHLGHCGQITDDAVIKLVTACNRIRYIDLGCCVHLTDKSVTKLATLPKLRRIGLVKCSNISDASVYALAQAHSNGRRREVLPMWLQDAVPENYVTSNLERVHLSYCTNLTMNSIIVLLNNCQKLTHLSLTGVQAFLRNDLEPFCREAPAEFNEHQRSVFCVFSGRGVRDLRDHLNNPASHADPLDEDGNLEDDDDDDDQTMTGMPPPLAAPNNHTPFAPINPVFQQDDGDDGDEELDDGDMGGVGLSGS